MENCGILELKIKPMTIKDIDSVEMIEKQSYGEHHWSKESFFNELSNDLAFYFCAFDKEDNLLGYIGTWQIFEEAHITTISVKPEYRRKKIGEALLHYAIENCYENKIK